MNSSKKIVKDTQQSLMDEVYAKWKDERKLQNCMMERSEIIKKYFTPKHEAACLLGNLNYQVENGGFYQWFDNRYMISDYAKIVTYCKKAVEQGISDFPEILTILENLKDFATIEFDVVESDCFHCTDEDGEDTKDSQYCDYCSGTGYIEEEAITAFFKDEYNTNYYNITTRTESFQEFLERFDEEVI